MEILQKFVAIIQKFFTDIAEKINDLFYCDSDFCYATVGLAVLVVVIIFLVITALLKGKSFGKVLSGAVFVLVACAFIVVLQVHLCTLTYAVFGIAFALAVFNFLFSILLFDAKKKNAEVKPVEEVKPAEEAKPVEEVKPAEEVKPVEKPKPAKPPVVKLTQEEEFEKLSDEFKKYYQDIKNYASSLQSVKMTITKSNVSFKVKKNLLLKLAINKGFVEVKVNLVDRNFMQAADDADLEIEESPTTIKVVNDAYYDIVLNAIQYKYEQFTEEE